MLTEGYDVIITLECRNVFLDHKIWLTRFDFALSLLEASLMNVINALSTIGFELLGRGDEVEESPTDQDSSAGEDSEYSELWW